MSHKLNIYLPKEIEQKVALNYKQLRLQKGYKQQTVAEKSGVSLGSIKRFESTGKISLFSLIKIANIFGAMDEFLNLFPKLNVSTISDLEKLENQRNNKRGTLWGNF